jgi:uncharacterized phage protein gp47/JayE
MATTPTITGPDGVERTLLRFSTTLQSRFFTGTIGADTVDVEVSIRGGGFTNDADLVVFEGTIWTVPNPAAFPDGLDLLPGRNSIQVRSVDASGSVSAPAEAVVTLVQEADIGIVAAPPTNISVTQLDGKIRIDVEGLDDEGFQGFNFYASIDEGGGNSGYRRINLETVSEGTTTEELSPISTIETDSGVVVDINGDPVADPLFFRVTGQQEDEDLTVIQLDLNERVAIAETVREIRTTITIESVREIQTFGFDHNRLAGPNSDPATISNSTFAALSAEELLYYVVTAVFFDALANVEFESSFSQEVVAQPLRITATLGSFPTVSRQALVRDFITSVFRSNPQIRVEEGATLRETVIDPHSSETERLRFILDFLHRARSPTQLLTIDDPTGSGTSISVTTSAYKQALKKAFLLTNNADVQALIDSAIESYASNFGVFRRPGRSAQGEVTFFTRSRPTRTLQFPLGTVVAGGSRTYRTTRAASIPLNQIASFFDPVSGRFQVTVPVKAATVGSAGNVGAGQVRSISSAVSGVSVTNSAAMFGGQDQETNHQLVERARNRLASVDAGTARGYLQTAADVPGVVKANVVQAGHPLMQRDLDEDGVHRGGKVDVWVIGENVATVTDSFAFTFEIAQDVQFVLVSTPADLEFRAIDPNLSSENPIVEMLDFPEAGYEFRNASTGQVFDLTGVTITSFDTIRLSADVVQPPVDLTDVVLGSYRRRVGTVFVFPRQPVSEVTAVTGVVSGVLPATSFALHHPDPPLEKGRSSLAGDFLEIVPFEDTDGNMVPSGELITVEDESHVLIGEFPEFVDSLGAVFLTIVVTNEDGTITYKGPNDPSGDPDYTIILGDQTTALSIKRIEGGDIASGQTVLISYSHDENFTVTYLTNLVISVTQDAIEVRRHATADVIVKEAVPVPLELQATIVLNKGKDQSDVDPALRTNIENFLTNLRLGDPSRQSDIINIIENTSGVSYVVVPITKMVRGEGSQVVREDLTTDLAAEIVLLVELSTESVLVWLIKEKLDAATTNGGGSTTEFRGVVQDDVFLDLLGANALLTSLGIVAGRTYIIGAEGASIPGYSDDVTLGSLSSEQKLQTRKDLTGNRVLVSTPPSDSPVNHNYAVTYIVGADSGAKDINPGDAEYLVVGNFLFTYDQEQ